MRVKCKTLGEIWIWAVWGLTRSAESATIYVVSSERETKGDTQMTRTKAVVTTRKALKVYYAERPYRYMPTQTAILCDVHRSDLFAHNPSAYGNGEYFPVDQCEKCAQGDCR